MDPVLAEAYQAAVRRSSPRPSTWDDIIGNARAVEQIREAITAAKATGRPLPHLLLFGPPGTGKSTLSKVVAREFGGAFYETTASTFETQPDVIRFLWQMNEGRERTGKPSVLFVDEIHRLGAGGSGRLSIDQETVFSLLEDWKMDHNLIRKTVQDVNGREFVMTDTDVLVWPFTMIGATTEPGLLSQPLLRRFLLHIELEPYTEAEITQIIMGSARRLEWPITESAAAKLAAYGRRTPGTALQLLTSASSRAVATSRPVINDDVAAEVIDRMNLFPLGLNSTDVKVLTLLYDRVPRGVGQGEICRALGISLSQFTGLQEPYLRLLGFMETLSRRVITAAGIRYLRSINKIDATSADPTTRAALAASPRD